MTAKCDLRGTSRRDFIRATLTASAALGLGPLRALEVLDRHGGSALADEACASTARTVHIAAGNGGLSWFTLLWPLPQVVQSPQPRYAYDDLSSFARLTQADQQSLYVRRVRGVPLWNQYGSRKHMTCLVAGQDETHRIGSNSTSTLTNGVGGANGLYAACAAMQGGLQTLIPVVSVQHLGESLPYGSAAGAPAATQVSSAEAMISMFSSAASQLADRLADPRNQQLFTEYHKAYLGLARTVDRPTYQRAYGDAKLATALLAQNLGDVLRPDPEKLRAWCEGLDPNLSDSDGRRRSADFIELAKTLLVTANAFKLGLVGQVILPALQNDPHPVLAPEALAVTIQRTNALARILQGFFDELADPSSAQDPLCRGSGKTLADNLVLTVSGDTIKNPFDRMGWPDAPPGNANILYVMSNGYLKPGWFGQISPSGRVNFDPRSGQARAGVSAQDSTSAAIAGVLHAVARGNDRLLRQFFTGEYSGVVSTQTS